ncbi:flagellar hook-basal body complex protein FliE [Cohnella fermenti]|uniref:Flagellar hook-basal body complex protein FliE n=1 Tax=Cohnella fermenti TaxID=2565925 RepID=A0A4S4C2J8_9BACL|nr:flagellar hook-basal body complex protein FliE [Cohnella fermenti]THF81269.1 flagellar hook-basal body complex protein FliE [Cohnella fermenti]
MISIPSLSAIQPAISSVSANSNISANAKTTTPAEATESFANFLQQALDSVAAQEQNVHTVNDQFIIGQADVNDVLIAASRAELSLDLTSQVRNKVIEAYQEIMRITI